MKSEQQIFDFVKTTNHLAVVGKDNWDSLFEATFEKEYPDLKANAISYQGEHPEDEIFECNNALVAWINWETGSFYVVPAYTKPSLGCVLKSYSKLDTFDDRIEFELTYWSDLLHDGGCFREWHAEVVKQYNRYHELKANPSTQLIAVARNVLSQIGRGWTKFTATDLKCTKGELWYIAHLIEDCLWERNLAINHDKDTITIAPATFTLH